MTDKSGPLDGEIIPPARDEEELRAQQRQVESGFWRTVKRAMAQIPFIDEVVAAYYCTLDQNTPWRVRATLTAALAYFVLPLDAVPDFLLGLGFTDDAAVLLAALNMMRTHIKPAHREAAKRMLTKYRSNTRSDRPGKKR